MQILFKPESGKAAFPGIVTGIAAFLINFVILKENRVVEGEGYLLFNSTPVWLSVLIFSVLLLVLISNILNILPENQKVNYIAGCLILFSALMALKYSGIVLRISEHPYGRISISGGAWMLFLSSYLLMNCGNNNELSTGFKLLPWAILAGFLFGGYLNDLGIIKEFQNEKKRFYEELGTHLYLSVRSVFQAVIIGVPLGILAWKREKTRASVFAVINSLQTFPSLALFGILIPPLAWLSFRFPELRELGFRGVGQTPAIIALTLYALLPVTRNTFTSLSIIENRLLDAGKGMGMTPGQLFWKVELPIGLPIILGGVRIALVQTTGNATVAALIGAGGLGFFVFRGLEQAAPDLILMGVIPIIILVLFLDKAVSAFIKILTPKGLELLYDSI